MRIDKNLNWITQIHNLGSKLSKANSVLSKLRHFVSVEVLLCYISISYKLFLCSLGSYKLP